jgi:hypothetical protein
LQQNHPYGFDANSTAQLTVGWDQNVGGPDSCYLIYNIQANALYLMDDTGSTMLGGVAPGSNPASPLQNSQCTINVQQTTATVSGGTVTLSPAITFDPSFVGALWIAPAVSDTTALWEGFAPLAYSAFAANPAPPSIVSLPIPAPGMELQSAI